MANQPDEHKEPEIPPVFDDEDTRKRIDEHLSNPESKITEEDIRNINTEPNPRYKVDPDSVIDDENKKEDEEKKYKELREKNDDKGAAPMQTPWDILGPH